MLKNSSTLALSVPINSSIKLGFVTVNGFRETYFVDVVSERDFLAFALGLRKTPKNLSYETIGGTYSVLPFLWRVVYKLSSEAGCGEVTNPK